MTSRQRIRAILTDQPYDHYGISETFWPETLRDVWPRQGYPAGVDPIEFFQLDVQNIGAGSDATTWRDTNVVVEESEEWRVTRSGWGGRYRYWKHHSGTPEHIGFEIRTPEDWKPYRERLLGVTVPDPTRIEKMKANRRAGLRTDRFLTYNHLFIAETLRHALGDLTMLESLILEPEWIKDINRTLTDLYIRHYDHVFRKAGKPDGMYIFEDLGFRNGTFASPKTLRELFFPYYAELVAFYHRHDLPVILHSCGGITAAVPMIVEAGFDCLQALEAKAGVNVVDLARRFGDRLAFMGNIDVTKLNTNDRAVVREEVVGKLERLHDLGARYIFHSDHSIPPDVHYDTYRYAVDLYREFCATHPCGA